ncbi:MAG: F390 synthetase-related protein [Cyanobacteria bacterium J06648_16]
MNALLPLLWSYGRTKSRRFSSREALVSWQEKRVQQFLRQILPQSAFYRAYYQGLPLSNWRQFPLIDKSVMMANFDRLNTAGIALEEAMAVAKQAECDRNFRPTLKGYTVGLSSGTSGNRGLFLVSPAEQAAWAGAILAKTLPGSLLDRHNIAFFLRANSNLYRTVQQRRIQLEYFDLSHPLDQHIDRLNAHPPSILVAPPSMLRFLAEAQQQGKLSISPSKIISVAEVLDPIDEQVIRDVFRQTLHQIYQCTEGFLATTCAYGTLHLNEDSLVIQKDYIDEHSGRFAPIITDFNRTTQPIIRYRLDDILTKRKTPCPCGSPLTALSQIEGRCDDIFYLPARNGSKLVPVFPDSIRRTLILTSDAIQAYAVTQTAAGLEVHIKVPGTQGRQVVPQVKQALQQLFTRLDCQVPELTFVPYEQRQPSTQKRRRIQRTCSQATLRTALR